MNNNALGKFPQIGILFWIMKISATTLGETGGDLLAQTLGMGYVLASVVFLALFLATFLLQIRAERYTPVVYWAVIVTTATAGTTLSDMMDRTLGWGYAKGTLVLSVLLLCIFSLWLVTEKTLSVDNIRSRRAETFYWSAILFSNTLGTALGDFLADDSGLGFAGGALLIGSLLALLVVLYYFSAVSKVLLFWLAFVLTRPFGATFGDFLTKPLAKGGLDLGTAGSSALLFGALVGLVVWEIRKERKVG